MSAFNESDFTPRELELIKQMAAMRNSDARIVSNDEMKQAMREFQRRTMPASSDQFDQDLDDGLLDEQILKLRRMNQQAHANFGQLINIQEQIAKDRKAELDKYIAIGDTESELYKAAAKAAEEAETYANNLIREQSNARFKNVRDDQKWSEARSRNEKYSNTMEEAKIQRDLRLKEANKLTGLERDEAIEYANREFETKKELALAERGDLGIFGLFGENGGLDGMADTVSDAISAAIPGAGTLISILTKVAGVLNSMNKYISQGVEKATNLAEQYLGSIDARLAGNKDNITYSTISEWMSENFSINPFVKQENIMQNIASIVESGIAYNVEERALVETIKDKMVATFDVLDTSLTRLVRLQQADLTAPQLGAEAYLTELLNSQFKDTSYLSDMYDSVSAAILDASSQFNYQDSVAFNYAVQKWLAALYSVGISDNAVSSIASGLNYLATGDVKSFTGNEELTALFGLAAKNASMSISDMLTNGLNASGVNELMKSMVTYLQEIVDNTGNQVTKAAWGNITNFSVSDLRAIQNLTSSDIGAIYNSNADYASSLKMFNTELGLVNSRTSVSEIVNNLRDNLLLTIGNNMIDNGDGLVNYLAYSIGGVIGGKLGEFVQGISSFFGAIGTVGDVFDNIGGIMSSLSDYGNIFGGTLNWQYVQERGGSFVGVKGVSSGTSSSSGLIDEGKGSAPDDAITASSVASYTTFAENASSIQVSTISDASASAEKTAADIYKSLFEDDGSTPIRIKLVELDSNLKDSIREDLKKDFHMGDGDFMEEIRNKIVYGSVPVTLDDSFAQMFGINGYVDGINRARNT